MFITNLNSFFLAGSFKFCFWGALPFAHFIYCLPCCSRLSIFYRRFYFIDLTSKINFFVLLVCVSSVCASLSFWALAFVGFLWLHKDTIFTLSRFFLNYLNLCLALGWVGLDSAAPFMWTLMKFSYSLFGVSVFRYLLKCIKFLVLHLPYIFIAKISNFKWGPFIAFVSLPFVSYFYIYSGVSLLWQFCDRKILLQKRNIPHRTIFIYYLFVSMVSIWALALLAWMSVHSFPTLSGIKTLKNNQHKKPSLYHIHN